MATNCCPTPTGRLLALTVTGVIVMEDRVAEITARVMVPETPSKVALMVAVPAATGATRPPLTVATAVFDEVQEASGVIIRPVPSE